MSDAPGTGELTTGQNPSQLSPQEQKVSIIHAAKTRAEIQAERLEPNYLQAIASIVRTAKRKYQSVVLPLSTKNVTENSFIPLQSAINSWSSEFDKIPTTSEMFRDNIPHHVERVNALFSNLRHDATIVINGMRLPFTEKGVPSGSRFAHPSAIKWTENVMERIARQVEKRPVIEQFQPKEVYDYLTELFPHISQTGAPMEILVNIDPEIKTISCDRLLFEGMNFNPIRNSQNLNATRVKVSLLKQGENAVLTIHDDAGGFPDKLLEKVPQEDIHGLHIKDRDGLPKMIKRALQRGTSQRKGGSGLGLDITRQIAEEHLNGSADIYNAPFPGTKQMGAVVEITFPYKG